MRELDQTTTANRRKRASWVRLLEWIVVIGILVWVVRILAVQFGQMDWSAMRVSWDLALWSLAGATISNLILAWVMGGYFRELGHPVTAGTALVLATLPRLGRFVPGKVHTVFGTVWLAHRLGGIPVKVSATVALLVTYQFAAISVVCAALIAPFCSLGVPWTLLLVAGGGLGLLGIHPWFSLGPINWLLRRLGKEPLSHWPSYSKLLALGSIAAFQRLFGAGMFVLLAASLIEVDAALAGHVALSFVLATFSGLIAFFAPGGIGVQEGAFLLLLAPVLPAEQAALLTLAARIWQTLVVLLDAGIGGIVLAFSSRGR